jgi:hypothetical protein
MKRSNKININGRKYMKERREKESENNKRFWEE